MLKTSPDRPVDPLLHHILQLASAAAQGLGIDFFVGGALARDLMLWHVHGHRRPLEIECCRASSAVE